MSRKKKKKIEFNLNQLGENYMQIWQHKYMNKVKQETPERFFK